MPRPSEEPEQAPGERTPPGAPDPSDAGAGPDPVTPPDAAAGPAPEGAGPAGPRAPVPPKRSQRSGGPGSGETGVGGNDAAPQGDAGPPVLPPADPVRFPTVPRPPEPVRDGDPGARRGPSPERSQTPDERPGAARTDGFLAAEGCWPVPPARGTTSDWSRGYLGEDYLVRPPGESGRAAGERTAPGTPSEAAGPPADGRSPGQVPDGGTAPGGDTGDPPAGRLPAPRGDGPGDGEPHGTPAPGTSCRTARAASPRDQEADPPRDQDAGPGPAGPARPDPRVADSARARLAHAVRPRASRAQFLSGVLCAVLGFALVVQVKQTQEAGLDSLRQDDLVRILDNITQNSNRLDSEAQSLQDTLEELRTGSDRSSAAQEAARERLDNLGLLAGTLPATGPGIELDIVDPQHTVGAGVLLNTVQELRDAGAEAIQIEDVRVIASTSFVDTEAGITVDGNGVSAPYHLVVVGDAQTLAAALNIPGGVLEVLRSQEATGSVSQRQSLTVDAVRNLSTPQYAHPVPTRSTR